MAGGEANASGNQSANHRAYEQWLAEGSQDVTARALQTAKSLLQSYEQPQIDPGIDEALKGYVARREREIPAMDALNQDH